MIERKKKICIQCKFPQYIFSHGRCKTCAGMVGKVVSIGKKVEKKESVKSLITELDTWFSRFIRLRDSDVEGLVKCITCNKKVPIVESQACHYVSRGSKATRFMENNVFGGCIGCNILKKGNYIKYTRFMEKKFGVEYVKALEDSAHNTVKWTRFEYQVLIDIYKVKVNQLLIEKSIKKWW